MIWHDHKFIFIQFHIWTDFCCLEPFVPRNFANIIQNYFAIHNLTKNMHALIGAYGNEIRAGLSVIISLQSDGTTMMFLGIVFHDHTFHRGTAPLCPKHDSAQDTAAPYPYDNIPSNADCNTASRKGTMCLNLDARASPASTADSTSPTIDSVTPSGFASTTSTAFRSTNNK